MGVLLVLLMTILVAAKKNLWSWHEHINIKFHTCLLEKEIFIQLQSE